MSVWTNGDKLGNNDFEERKAKHLEFVRKLKTGQLDNNQPCLHDSCPECFGTGIKGDGTTCIHHLSCPCPKCTPRC